MISRLCSLIRMKPPILANRGLLFASGPTVPADGTDGYQTGCIFQHTDGGTGTAFYINEGSVTSSAFAAVAGLTAEQEALLGATAGTVAASKAVVVDASKDVTGFRNLTLTGLISAATATLTGLFTGVTGLISSYFTFTAGAAAAAVAVRFGASATEGLEIKAIDETVTLTNAVETDLTETVPSGAVILSVQANLETTVVGDASGDDGLAKVGIGTNADPDKYGLSADLVKNTKIDTIPDWAVLSGAETITVKAADAAGAAVTELFVAGGEVRVRIVYAVPNSLDDAA